jgi:single-strand DNA-binding protein
MSRDFNQSIIVGRIGQEIECKFMPNGKAVVNISLASGDDYKDKQSGQKVDRTNWIDVVAFDRLAEILRDYCKKGSKILVTGKLTKRKWQDKDGANRYTTEVVASDLQMLDPKPEGQQNAPRGTQQQAAPQNQQAPAFDDFDQNEPPF